MRKIITSLIAILVVTNLEAQQRTPKLVVCITVDQLRGDYIEYFYNTFGERGFKRLMNEGLVYNNIRFEFSDIDQASAFATLFTGSNPCFSGIAGDKTFDFEKEKEVSILNDPEYLGKDYETNEKTACICTGICDDHHDLSAISGICSNQKTKIKCKDNDTSGGTEKDPESKKCREKGQIEVVQQ